MSRAERGGWAAAAGAEKVLWLVVGAPKKVPVPRFSYLLLVAFSKPVSNVAIDVSCHIVLSRPKWDMRNPHSHRKSSLDLRSGIKSSRVQRRNCIPERDGR